MCNKLYYLVCLKNTVFAFNVLLDKVNINNKLLFNSS